MGILARRRAKRLMDRAPANDNEARYFREVDQELRPWPVMFTLVPLAIGCAILVWVPILIPLWHWLRGY